MLGYCLRLLGKVLFIRMGDISFAGCMKKNNYLPTIVKAQYLEDFRLKLVFDDKATGEIDFKQFLRGVVFKPLKEKKFFKKFFVDGGTVCWPNGADVAPETLYDLVAQQHKISGTKKKAA
jgi:hypothetical protein